MSTSQLPPFDLSALLAKAHAAMRTGRAGDAYEALRATQDLIPRPHAGTSTLLGFLHRHAPRTRHAELDEIWHRALVEVWARPADIALDAARYLACEPTLATALDTGALSPALAPQLEADALFHALVRTTVIPDPRWERLLLALMARQLAAGAETSCPRLTETLALWAWLSERVALPVPSTDQYALSQSLLARTRAGHPPVPAELAQAALAAPLQASAWAALLDVLPESEIVHRLLREPLREAQLAVRWPAPAAHDTAVAGHYETAPYPRWLREPLGLPVMLPPAVLRELSTAALCRPEVLIAGCGTGQQLFVAHDCYADARLTALDVSRGSLAYACRQCETAGLAVAEWRCADLLDLPGGAPRYAVVECIGVLHHLVDPLVGLRALAAVTVPGGLLHAAVYSRRARTEVTALRARLVADGVDLSTAKVSTLRQALLRGDYGAVTAALIHSVDFYSSSGCRDLLLNAREHVYELPAFVEEAAAAGFDWLALSAPVPVAAAAGAQFGKPAERLTVGEWHDFEADHPQSFGGMFDCWFLRRP